MSGFGSRDIVRPAMWINRPLELPGRTGLQCWIAAHVGGTCAKAARSGEYHVPDAGSSFRILLAGGFFSPNKWLMLIALLDFSLTYLPVFLLKEHLKKSKSERKSKDIKR
ncbi:MAG: hypothetical protein ACLUGQ_12230 [Coprococcus sp.]